MQGLSGQATEEGSCLATTTDGALHLLVCLCLLKSFAQVALNTWSQLRANASTPSTVLDPHLGAPNAAGRLSASLAPVQADSDSRLDDSSGAGPTATAATTAADEQAHKKQRKDS